MRGIGTAGVILSAPIWIPLMVVVAIVVKIGLDATTGVMKLHQYLWKERHDS